MRTILAATMMTMIAATSVPALDHPVSAIKLVLRRSADGAEKLTFVSKDITFVFPAIGGADDPSLKGLTIEIVSSAEPAGGFLAVPAGTGNPGWTVRGGTVGSYRFVNHDAPAALSPIRLVAIKQGRGIKIVGRSTGLALAASQGAVSIRVRTGSLRQCARFDGPTIKNDVAGRFVARNAAATGDCSDATLGVLGTCGDGRVNQSSEECDGGELSECSTGACRPPGFSGECNCCSNGGPDVQIVGCCDPSAILIPAPDLAGSCLPTRCDPPFSCGPGQQCLPTNQCCAGPGTTTALTALGLPPMALNACCPGLVPDAFNTGGIACCIPGGGTCTNDVDCCTHHCTGGTCDACKPAGAACTDALDCCTGSCLGGTCGPCQPAGASCFRNSHCCSDSCDTATLTCNS